MKRLFHRVAACLLATSASLSNIPPAQAADVTNLRCEYLVNPLGIASGKPRLSWVIEERSQKTEVRGAKQTAYQALVASSEELLKKDKGDLWDSGKVASDTTSHIEECRETAPEPPAILLESECLDRQPFVGTGIELEQTRIVGNGTAQAGGLESQMDRGNRLSVLEDAANPLNFVPQPDWPPDRGDAGAEVAEVVGHDGGDGRLVAKRFGDPLARGLVLAESPLGDFAGFAKLVLVGKELVANVFDGGAHAVPGSAAGKKLAFLVQPGVRGLLALGVVGALAEVDKFAVDNPRLLSLGLAQGTDHE